MTIDVRSFAILTSNVIVHYSQENFGGGKLFHALVCVKQVPDTTNIRIDPETGNLIRQGVPSILNPYDAHAVASAVEWKRKLDGMVTVISMGPAAAAACIRECIEMGADEGILLSARQFSGADTLATSYVLAEAIKAVHKRQPLHLIFFGKQAIDGVFCGQRPQNTLIPTPYHGKSQ